ncbi:MAG: hypothetical protein U5J97_00110 [Trueperaceae bacterium]|nr:hypothetical protein [Trueperaceae bacterium]
MIPALRSAQTPTTKRIEWLRVVMMFLLLMSFAMYPVELFIVGHWLDTWQSLVPFVLTVPGVLFTAWVLFFDRSTPWVRTAFIVTMWASIFVGVLGGYYHWIWNMLDVGGIQWNWSYAMEEFHGYRPVLAAMAYTYMGITGLASIYRAE